MSFYARKKQRRLIFYMYVYVIYGLNIIFNLNEILAREIKLK